MKLPNRHLLGLLVLVSGLMLAGRFWPGNAPQRRGAPAPMGGDSAAAQRSDTIIPGGKAGPRERDLVIGERTLNAAGLVSIDERLVGELRLPLLAPNRRDPSPLAITVLDLSQGESAAMAEALAEAGRSLKDELNARATLGPVKEGIRISYHLEPAEIRAREQELRTRIATGLDPNSQRYLQKVADGALLATLLPVPLGDITVTITRNDRAEYRAEMTGRDAGGNTLTSWWVARADTVIAQFYGPQARRQLPLIEDDLAAIIASRRGGARSPR
jgi:hypothetical protein